MRWDGVVDGPNIAPVQSAGREMRYGLRRLEIISAHIVDADDRNVHTAIESKQYSRL
jgi:hypothetical protein